MKSLVVAAVVLVSGAAFAQEIGTEITPTTPTSGANNGSTSSSSSSSSTTTQPEQKGGYVYRPQGAKKEEPTKGTGSSSTGSGWDGTKLSASSGDFGLRAGFGASGAIALPSGSASAFASSFAAPTVGVSIMAADSFKLLVDLGFGMAISGSTPIIALSATLGFDYLFRTPGDAMRPFFHLAGSFNMAGSSNFVVGFGAQLGFGAEYFFSPSFSVNGRLLLAVPMAVPGDFVLGIFTVTPGVGATWYL